MYLQSSRAKGKHDVCTAFPRNDLLTYSTPRLLAVTANIPNDDDDDDDSREVDRVETRASE